MKTLLPHELSSSTLARPSRWVALLVAGLGSVSAAFSQVTIGDALDDRAYNDNASGGVYVYTGAFGQAGMASTWSFYTDQAAVHELTPLLFQRLDSITFELTGVGASLTSTTAGAKTAQPFNLLAGSAVVGADYTFGFTDRAVSYGGSGSTVTTDLEYAGAIDYNVDGAWLFTPSSESDFGIQLGQIYQVNASLGGGDSVIQLYGSQYRAYSAQLTLAAIPEPATSALWLGLAVLAGLGCQRGWRRKRAGRPRLS